MDAVPRGLDVDEICAFLEGIRGVVRVHDLHVWAMSTTEIALTVHLIKPDAVIDDKIFLFAAL